MNEIIITNTNGELTTSSLGVAEKFGKQHKHVIEKIGNIIAEMNSAENSAQYSTEKSAQYFIESIYIDNSGKSNKCYELTRDGFSLLVMGFTGKKALEWKLKYIEAFNLMEQKLREKLEINNTMDLNILTETIGTAISKVLTSQLEICVENAIQKYLPKPNTKKINTWKSQVVKPIIDKIHNATSIPIENIYKIIYFVMQEIHGFNQCYAITSYCDKYNLETCSVIDAIADNIEYQEQFVKGAKKIAEVMSMSKKINLLLTINEPAQNNNIDNEQAAEDDVFAEEGIKEGQFDAFFEVVEPLARRHNDNSIYFVATLRKVYQRMKSARAWKILKTRKKCNTIKEVIESDMKLIKLYDDTVAEMLAELDE